MLSIIIPTLNAGSCLGATLASLPKAPGEVIISDGGSKDSTLVLADAWGARIVAGPPGRGAQLIRGAQTAAGDWLLFLHADTCLATEAAAEMEDHMSGNARLFQAAAFTFRLDGRSCRARLIERGVNMRCRWLALPYGDQGLLISRAFYDALGGFKPMPLMEDLDLVRRIGRKRLRLFKSAAVTSAERYRRDGYGRRVARNAVCLALYSLGLPPERIKAFYEK